jgi:hypothetical protein
MSAEPEPNKHSAEKKDAESPMQPTADQDHAARDAAAKALEQAKEGIHSGVATFKKLDRNTQIYLGGMTIAFLCSIIFDVISVSMKSDLPGASMFNNLTQSASVTAFDAGANGKLAVLAALAGIGLWIWNRMAKKKEPWVPLALAGSAGFSALMFLVLMLRSGSSMSAPGVSVSVSMTLFGFWIPFAGTIAATVVSVKGILNPAAK